MRILRNLALLLLSFALSVAPGLAETRSADSRLDPMLKMLSEKTISIKTAKTMNMIKQVQGAEQMVKTIVRFKDNLNGIESLGGKIGSVVGDIATVDIPLNSLKALSQMDNIIYIEASKKVKPSLDISVPETGANLLRGGVPPSWTGIAGKDVIIGVIDTGIDLTHPDFRDAAGKTRILYLLDQTTGQECTNDMIDGGTCNETDTEGHGTHVSGIAAGNGSAPNFRYVGMAPEANLIFVKTTFDSQDILNGISYIEQKAASLGKPCVINLSLGGHIDPHDGTSNYSRGLDNDSGPGRIIAGAAGNEADDGIHASGNVSQGNQTQKAFDIQPGTSAVTIDTWYSGSDSMSIAVIPPGCNYTDRVAPGEQKTFTNACGNITVVSSLNNPNNGDKEISIELENPAPGQWWLSLFGSSVTNGRFDSWTATDNENAAFESPDSSITLDDTGCTTRVISAASYVTRPLFPSDPTAGNISSFSSHGPRRLCSLCSYVQKPDIAAPGQWIMSAFSKDTLSPDSALLDPFGGPYIMDQGTSMATPHVTGAVALMLQQSPVFTPEDVKDRLFPTARVDSNTGSVPNNIWGYGKLDVFNAVSGTSISLQLPQDNTSFDACSLYSVPAFSWLSVEPFKKYELQFSIDENFGSTPVRVRTSATQITMAANTWKKVLLLPGGAGGTVYWRTVGTRTDKTTSTSDVYSITVQSPQAAGSPSLSSASKSSLPSLSWQNDCNIKFKVWFANDSDFTKAGIKKKALVFNIKNPNDNVGTFTRQLTSGQWTSIRKLVEDASGSPIYWYIESWDGLKRYAKTEVMNFNLTE